MIRIKRSSATTTKIASTTSSRMMKICPTKSPIPSMDLSLLGGHSSLCHLEPRPQHAVDRDALAGLQRDLRLRSPGLTVGELDHPVAVDEVGDHPPRHTVQG